MDAHIIQRLNQINQDFYRITAQDFNATRGQAWAGWHALLPFLKTPLSVLDVGCGNGRFGLFLADTLGSDITYTGVDNNSTLLTFAHQTLASTPLTFTLITQDIVEVPLQLDLVHLVVCFGVLHHIPGYIQRQAFIKMLAQQVAPNGLLVFATWRFYESPRFVERIVAWPDDLPVEKHDYLLDWRRGETALRYCHYIDDAEQAELIAATGLKLLKTYRADNNLNCYSLLLQQTQR